MFQVHKVEAGNNQNEQAQIILDAALKLKNEVRKTRNQGYKGEETVA